MIVSQHPLFARVKVRSCTRQRRLSVIARASKTTRNTAKTLNKCFSALVSGSNAPKVALTQSSAGLGLIAAAPIAAKEAVLVIPEANSLTVPEAQGSSVYAWEGKWLAPFEAEHGPLPPALAYFLSDRDAPALSRLSALILYIRKHAKSDLWKGWLALLPSLQSATFPGGPWTAAEVEQLQLEPLKMLVADNHAYYVAEAQQLFSFLSQDPDKLGLQQLQLADTVEDCLWAQFIAATRGSDAGTDDSSLHPLHDLMNHRDAPNCAAGVSTEQEGFIVQAAVDIEPGSELTLCYAKPSRLSSVEMLLSWGFYPATRPTDWAFNQHVHALPPLPYDALVAAAAQLLLLQATDNNSSNGSSDGKQLLEAAMQGRLLAVVGSLPLQLPPELLLLQAAGSAAAAAAAADTSYVPYAHAAAVALKYGLRENVLEPLEAADGNTEVPAIAAERFKVPSSQQRELAQAAFAQDVQELAATGSSSSSEGVDAQQQQLQQCCARALACACNLRLIACSTTIQQDEQLLQQLLQPAQALASAGPSSKDSTMNKAARSTNGFRARSVQHAAPYQSNSSSSSSSSSNSAEETATTADSNGVLLQSSEELQQQLSNLEDLQQQVQKQLLVLQATCVLSRNSSSSADVQAAQRVVAAVQLQQPPQLADVAALQEQQAAMLQNLQETQQQQQRRQAAGAQALLADDRLGLARLVAATEARLERKRMLRLCADLCGQLATGLQ